MKDLGYLTNEIREDANVIDENLIRVLSNESDRGKAIAVGKILKATESIYKKLYEIDKEMNWNIAEQGPHGLCSFLFAKLITDLTKVCDIFFSGRFAYEEEK